MAPAGLTSTRGRARNTSLWLLITFLMTLNYDLLVHSKPTEGVRRISKMEAVQMSRNFRCNASKERAYNLADLLQINRLFLGESVGLPIYLVLKRCDGGTGCCSRHFETCMPVPEDIKPLEVQIELVNFVTDTRRLQTIRVEQHGACKCGNAKRASRLVNQTLHVEVV